MDNLLNTVLHGDCLELMKDISDKSVDMILCDLPYGTTSCKWDAVIPFVPLWEQYERIIKDNGAIVLTSSQPFTSALIMSNPKLFKYTWSWNKKKPTGFLNAKKQPLRTMEDVNIFYKKQSTYNPQLIDKEKRNIRMSSYKYTDNTEVYGRQKEWEYNKGREIPYDKGYPVNYLEIQHVGNNGGDRLHPTQKPVTLFEYLIKTYTNEGMTVLDNCAGSGTTAVACLNTSRNYILIEKDLDYFNLINKRIEEYKGV